MRAGQMVQEMLVLDRKPAAAQRASVARLGRAQVQDGPLNSTPQGGHVQQDKAVNTCCWSAQQETAAVVLHRTARTFSVQINFSVQIKTCHLSQQQQLKASRQQLSMQLLSRLGRPQVGVS